MSDADPKPGADKPTGKAAVKAMSTYAPVYNQAAKNKLMLFSVSENRHLTLRSFDTKGTAKPTDPTDTSRLKTGIISVPCTLTGLEFQEWTRIYGWLEIADPDDATSTEQHLYMLSPVHEAVADIKSKYTSLAGLVDADETGYLYYLDNNNKLWEQSLGESADPTQVAGTINIKGNTALTAYYGPEKTRYVAFQAADTNGSIQIWNATKKTLLSPDDNANPADKTPLAIIQYKDKNDQLTMNLYYVRKSDGLLMRSQSVAGGDWSSKSLTNAGKPSASTTLSATWNEELKAVFVTFSLGSSVTCVKDKW